MIRLAIVGTGGMAALHVSRFSKMAGCKIVAGCDVDEARVKAFCEKHAIPQAFSDLDLMLKSAKIDAVVNVTPDRFHAPVSLKVIAAGKHILCEKPLAVDYPEAMTMVKAAEKKGVINMVNFSYRRSSALYKARQLIESGQLGTIVHVDACYLQSWLVSSLWGDWRTSPSLTWKLSLSHGSKGVLGDIGIHIVDFVSFAVGDVKAVNAHLKTFSEVKGKKHGEFTLDANDTALIQVEFANGALGTIHTTRWATGYRNSIQLRVHGTKGGLRLDLDQGDDYLEISTGKDIDPGVWKPVACPKVPDTYERFIRAVRTGKKDQPNFRRGAEVQKVLDACFISDAKQTRVKV
jgi:predicted dehydrogenase